MKKIIIVFLMMTMLIGVVQSGPVSPLLKLSVSTYSPLPAVPGRNVDVWISVQNIGNDEAKDIALEFVDSATFKLLSDNDRVKRIPVLGAQTDYVVKYTFEVADDAPEGSNELLFKYTIGNLPDVSSEVKVSLDLKSTQSHMTISDVDMNPEKISPGTTSELSISIKNLAMSSSLKDLTVTLGLDPVLSATAILIDYPFVPIGSANQKTIDRILPGQTSIVRFDLAAYPEALSNIYKLPVYVSYYDDAGTNYNESVLVGVEVNANPELLTVVESSEITKTASSGKVNFEITNKGLGGIKLMTITLGESDSYDILSPSNKVYIGNIDSDDFESAGFEISANNMDELKFPLKMEYRDSLNRKFTDSVELSYVIRETQKGNGGSPVLTIVIILILVVGGFILYRRRKNRRRKG